MKKTLLALCATIALIWSCGTTHNVKSVSRPSPLTLNMDILRAPRTNAYINLDYGIKVKAYDIRSKRDIIVRFDANPIFSPETSTNPEIQRFMEESTRRYMKGMGFQVNADLDTDYLLSLKLSELSLSYFSNTGWTADVVLFVEVADKNGKTVYPSTSISGRSSTYASHNDYSVANAVVNEAYTRAIEDIDWDRIAYFLKKADRASSEKNKAVSGDGNTALESMVINWMVESSPRGADVYWRVVSSTPNVKNTNLKFLGTTPYEGTETFDIIGLTYNNSGNVQIEITCEKNGYVPQKKRFNLRSVIDQKEVSTKFSLIKDE